MKRLGAILIPIMLLALACGELATPGTPLPPDLEATVRAVIAEFQPGSEATTPPDTEATITARVQATVQALLRATAIPSPTPTQNASQSATSTARNRTNFPTPTSTGIPRPTPSVTPLPTLLVACATAPDGTEVSAWVNSTLAATTKVLSGEYTLFIEQAAGASFTGKTISLTVGNSSADQTVVWMQGGATDLVLTATSGGLGQLAPSQIGGPSLKGGPLAQPVPPHVVLGTAFVGNC